MTYENRPLAPEFTSVSRPTLSVDVAKYQKYLDGSNLSDHQKEEVLQALWSIMVSFVELGFGVHPLQEVCEKDSHCDNKTSHDSPNALSSSHTENIATKKDSCPAKQDGC